MSSSKEILASLLHPQGISDFAFDASFGWRDYNLRPLSVGIFDKAHSFQVISTLNYFFLSAYTFVCCSSGGLFTRCPFNGASYLKFSLGSSAIAWSLMNFYFHISLFLIGLYACCFLVCIRCSVSVSSDQHLLRQLHGGTMVFKDINSTYIDL
jgi:hypothetical protein